MKKSIPPISKSDRACRKICRFDSTVTYCMGCNRTLVEIQEWESYSLIKQNMIMKDLPFRQENRNYDYMGS